METVTLKPLHHRGAECIGIYAPNRRLENGKPLNYYFQTKAGARWSRTHLCWYVPCNRENYELLSSVLKDIAILDSRELKKYLTEKKKHTLVLPIEKEQETQAKPAIKNYHPVAKQPLPKINPLTRLSKENLEELRMYTQQLVLKGYSQSTIKTYTNEFVQFLTTVKDKRAIDFSSQRIKDYLQYCHETLKLSENTLHSRINALKFYFEQVLGREKFFWEIPRPKKPLLLPKLLNEDELKNLFNALSNKKHKAMLFTTYSAGLRVSEIVNLKIEDIDSKRMQIFVRRAKGKKDRCVNLSPLLLDILRKYLQEYKPKPKIYLFESETTFEAYPTRTVQQIFSNARHKARISKTVGVHSLRHSFATHLLDKGTDIKYIKDLLGHFSIKTTERYLHISKKQLVNIVSPFDDLYKGGEIEW
jgi:site-specific recombinase XerD